MDATTRPTPAPATTATTRVRERAITCLLAAVAAVAVWAVLVPLAGVDLRVAGAAVPAVAFAANSLGAGLLGWALLEVLERLVPSRAATAWTIVSLAFLVLSFAGPGTADATTATKLSLAAAHVVVAATYLPRMITSARRASR